MTDIFSPDKRSHIMASVKGKNTKIELIVRKELHKRGLRYRLHSKDIPGKPDLLFSRYRTVLFVNGCFWHGHGCKKSSLPVTNRDFWENKIKKNKERDQNTSKAIRKLGLRCMVLWECKINSHQVIWDVLANKIKEP